MTTAVASPNATMTHLDAEPLQEDGQCGGPDYNLGNDYSRRGTWQIGPNRFLSITVTGYVNGNVMDSEGKHLRDAEYEDINLPLWDETDEHTAPEYLRPYEAAQIEYFIFEQFTKDGEQIELDCDYADDSENVGYIWPGTIAKAEENVRKHVMDYDFTEDFDVKVCAGDYWQL